MYAQSLFVFVCFFGQYLYIYIKNPRNLVALYLAIYHGCDHSHTSENAYVPSVIVVITPHTSERKAYVLSVIVVITRSPYLEKKAYVLSVIVVIIPHT